MHTAAKTAAGRRSYGKGNLLMSSGSHMNSSSSLGSRSGVAGGLDICEAHAAQGAPQPKIRNSQPQKRRA